MRVEDIKDKADEILRNSKEALIKVFIVIAIITAVMGTVGNLIGGTIGSIIGLIITIAFLPFSHGYIVSSLKAVNNRDEEISIEEDSLVGFKRFKELFLTYFTYNFFLFIIIFLVIMLAIAFVIMTIPGNYINMLKDVYVDYGGSFNANLYLSDSFISTVGSILGIMLSLLAVIFVIVMMYSLFFALTPYVLERHQIRGAKAMSESARLMKGYKWLLFKINLSFIGWMILAVLLTTIIGMLIPISIIVVAIEAIIAVYLYEVKLQVCHAVLFEEIDLVDKQGVENTIR